MTPRLALRRIAVTAGVAACLVAGAATIRAASDWTAASAPLDKPLSTQQLASELAVEQARLVDLAARLDAVRLQTGAMNAALATAAGQVVADLKTAEALEVRLEAAEKKLKAVNRQIARAAARLRATAATPPVRASTRLTATPARTDDEAEDDD